jgi:adenylyl cyclase-associated protein
MQTHKNPALRFNSPQPFKPTTTPKPSAGKVATPAKQQQVKPPRCDLEGKKWIVEYQHGNKNVVIQETEMKQTVYIYKCENSTIHVKGKVNAITLDGCKKTGLVFDEAISSIDFINCQSVQVQVLSQVPTVSIDKTDGCMIYLSKKSLHTQVVSAKSSEMNVLVPDDSGEFKEYPIPEQFRTNWNGKQLVTEMTDVKVG